MTFKLRDYQTEAVAAVQAEWAAGVKDTLLVMATGGGKTQVFSELLDQALTNGHRAMVLVHRKELVDQARDRLLQFWPHRKDQTGIVMAAQDDWNARIVYGTVQTLRSEKRMARVLEAGPIDYLITDEAHHGISNSYQEAYAMLREANPDLCHLGVTATPIRADRVGLKDTFQSVAATYDIRYLVKQGYLVKPRWLAVQTAISLADIAINYGGDEADFNTKQLADVFETDNCFELVGETHRKYAAGRQAVAFCVSVDGAFRLAAELNRQGIIASAACAETNKAERARILRDFRLGKIEVLCNVGLYTEGLDVPSVSCIHQVRPTKSDGLYCLDLKTEILTKNGWKRYDEVNVGDSVAALNIQDDRTYWVNAEAKIVRPMLFGEKMYALSTPSIDIRVTGDHQMIYKNRNKHPSWIRTTANVLADRRTAYDLPVAGNQDASGVPLSDSEIALIGWYITDGTIGKLNNQLTITQSEHQVDHVLHIHRTLKQCGLKYRVHRHEYPADNKFNPSSANLRFTVSKGTPRGSDKHLSGWGHLEPYMDKDLSPLLEDLSESQLSILLNALHLGDGAKQLGQSWTRRSYHITSANKTFCDRLQGLCVRRGWRCNLAEHKNTNGNPIYCLHIKHETTRTVGGQREHEYDGRGCLSESQTDPNEQVWCIQTELGTIVTRRNGKVAILGNCQMIGRGLRTYPDKTDCLILDYAPKEWRKIVMLGDVLAGEVRKEAYIKDESEDGVLGGFTFDGECQWMEGSPAEIITRQLDYLDLSPWRWYRSSVDGSMSLGLGKNDTDEIQRIAYLGPIQDDGNQVLYAVWQDPKDRTTNLGGYTVSPWRCSAVKTGDFDTLQMVAEGWAEKWAPPVLIERSARWGGKPASEGQEKYARRLGVFVDGMTSGECAMAITHKLAQKSVAQNV